MLLNLFSNTIRNRLTNQYSLGNPIDNLNIFYSEVPINKQYVVVANWNELFDVNRDNRNKDWNRDECVEDSPND